ncbi:GMC oxidoreductase [Halalkalibacter sp. AB-rgal2]|uniref:GMC oxidoreductase n=1 Tax=Halalkalibacter sp. AB-rgal2 TaxID=3242695 RepID=UPI00359E11D7
MDQRFFSQEEYTHQEFQPDQIPICPPDRPEKPLDTWVPLTPIEEMAKQEYDVIIVGTGAGASALIWKLAQEEGIEEKKIGMIDAGGLYIPTHVNNIPTLEGRRDAYRFNDNISRPIGEPDLPASKQLIGFGGKAIIWGGVAVRFQPYEFTFWPISYDDIEPYYELAEQILYVQEPSTTVETNLFLQQLWRDNYPAFIMPFAARLEWQEGRALPDVFSSSLTLIGAALGKRDIDIAIHAPVQKVLMNGDQVQGVEAIDRDERVHQIKAKKVVLAANAFQTPRILLQSSFDHLPVGRYLIKHTFFKMRAFTSEKVGDFFSEITPCYVRQRPDAPYFVQIFPEADRQLGFYGFVKVLSRYRNRVTLDNNKLLTFYQSSELDRQLLHQALIDTERMIQSIGAEIGTEKEGDEPLCLTIPGSDYHESGTCRMGMSPSDSVVDSTCAVHGVKGLWIADNSILPTLGSNPTLTTMSLSLRTGDTIIRELVDE